MARWIGIVALPLSACLADGRVEVSVPLSVVPPDPITVDGFSLTAAQVDLTGLTFRTTPREGARRVPRASEVPGLILDVVVPSAHAHPGHDDGTDVVGEWLGDATVDLLDEVDLGTATLLSGAVDLVDLGLGTISLQGSATVGGQVLPFDWTLAIDAEVLREPLSLTLDPDDPPSTIAIALSPDALFTEMLAEPPAAGATSWTLSDDALANTFRYAIRQHDAWHVEPLP